MSLVPGTHLGPYEILGPLGAGGMGEVYRARDPRLARDVAIKALPAGFAQDPERLARFEREARLLASLNHPNIAGIYGLEQVEGHRYLVLEFVEGETLAARLAQGALPVDEALHVCVQIATALESAHEAGIIHRDLKPGNVVVKADGSVKVLDFGLAKSATGGSDANLSVSPTVTHAATSAGVILGTAAYMSPEQARGKNVDRRTDIWSFGCVMYECLTGRQAFSGETVSDVIARILQTEPDWSVLPTETPAYVRELLARCLRRDAKERQRDIGDARLELTGAHAGADRAATPAPARHAWWPRAALAFVAGAALVGAVAVWKSRGTGGTPAQVMRFTLHDTGMALDAFQTLALTPDGRCLAYTGHSGIFLHDFESGETETIERSINSWLPFFSPDGARVGYYQRGAIMSVATTGGVASELARVDRGGFSGAAWLEDDTIVFTGATAQIGRIPGRGGDPEYIDVEGVESGDFIVAPAPLPGAAALLCGVSNAGGFHVAVLDMTDHSVTIVAENGFTPVYVATGHVVFQQGTDGPLMALPFDAKRRVATGPAFGVVDDVGTRVSYQTRMFGVAGNGLLVYVPRNAMLDGGALQWVDRKGTVSPVLEIDRALDVPRLSRDGRRVAFRTPAPDCDVWVHDLERGVTTRVTRDGDNHGVAWTPDDRHLVFARLGAPERWAVYSAPVDGAAVPVEIVPPALSRGFVTSMSPDGEVVLVEGTTETGRGIFSCSVTDGKTARVVESRFTESAGMFSPDGRHIAYVSNESGRDEVYVMSFPGRDRREQISTGGGQEPMWSPTGRELFFRTDTSMMAAAITTQPTLSAGRPVVLFEIDPATRGADICYDVGKDGQRFIMVRERTNPGGADINIVLGWTDELKQAELRKAGR